MMRCTDVWEVGPDVRGRHADRSGIVWLSYQDSPTEKAWKFHDISGPRGSKFDLVPVLDLDGDGDLDVITTEEKDSKRGLGVIWYENPRL